MVIGVVGGMGSYATVDFFKRIVDSFPAEKEWDRPRIIIDNRCTMPSRVRALLYNEKRQELVDELISSLDLLIQGGCTHIVLACNTSHCFLDEIFNRRHDIKKYVNNIIELCAQRIHEKNISEVFLMASEGTIQTKIYDRYLSQYNIRTVLPDEYGLNQIREFIEAVKQNKINENTREKFYNYLNSIQSESIILGCTELPVIFRMLNIAPKKVVFDPLQIVIENLIKEIN